MPQDFDEQKFHESLPAGLQSVIYIVANDMEDLANKCNALVGRVYENKETGEGYFISGIKQIVIVGDGRTSLYPFIHAVVLPEHENIPIVNPD